MIGIYLFWPVGSKSVGFADGKMHGSAFAWLLGGGCRFIRERGRRRYVIGTGAMTLDARFLDQGRTTGRCLSQRTRVEVPTERRFRRHR